ncbi:hypothetical protein BH11BAC1_BH11BAC1_24030 [soil metagenome]
MKKTITKTFMLLLALCTANQLSAQQIKERSSKTNGDHANAIQVHSVTNGNHQTVSRHVNPNNGVQAIFDIQFNYPLGFDAGVSTVYTGTEFWVGIWNKDSLYTLDPAGNITAGFKIAGVGAAASGVRAITYDGTFIYAADNTTAIKKIDPATKTLVGTITAPVAVRGLAYDSTANAGAGGFWISNFNTDFTQISMTGAALDAITMGEHGVPSVYGIAFDPYSAGGPYIWAFGQGTSNPNDSAKLHRITIPTHSHSGLIHNVNADVAIGGSIAGSVSVTWRYDPNNYTLMGCTQSGTNNLFGYELADYTPPAVDAGCNSIDFYPPFTLIPTFEITQLNWDVNLTNNGTDPITDLATTFILDDGATAVYSPAAFHTNGFTPGSAAVASFGNFVPPPVPQGYNATASISPVGQTDQDATNDMQTYSMAITDTVMARDNGNPTGSLGLPDGSPGVLGQVFEIPSFCYISSATFLLRNPVEGDSVNVDLYNYAGLPDVVVASTTYYLITAADSDGVEITLPFIGGPFAASAGLYFLGVNQVNSNISLATSSFNWRPDAAYFMFAGAAWQTVESNANPFILCYILRMNMLDPSISVAEIGNHKFQVYPNPATSQLTIQSDKGNTNFSVELYDMIGNKVMETSAVSAAVTTLDVSRLATGMYIVKTIVDGNSTSTKVSINQ